MAEERAEIGFVGLGNMGGNMAERFLAAGYPVFGSGRNRDRALADRRRPPVADHRP
jgi:3-hydroxyisobutyrate dehydrogenase-like beta-hydroxyacid dehydrogenase